MQEMWRAEHYDCTAVGSEVCSPVYHNFGERRVQTNFTAYGGMLRALGDGTSIGCPVLLANSDLTLGAII
jgi:hypothetical protein